MSTNIDPKELTVEEAKAKKAEAVKNRANSSGGAIKDYPLAATSISDFTGPNKGVPGEEQVETKPLPASGPEAVIAEKNAKAEAQRKKEQAEALKKADDEEAAKIADAKAKLGLADVKPPKA